MNRSASRKIFVCFILIVFSSFSAEAAEIRLNQSHHCRGPLVRLGDIADVSDSDPEKANALARLELFPAPIKQKTLKARELREILALRGVNLVRCRFSGAAVVAIYSEASGSPTRTKQLSQLVVKRVRKNVQRSIMDYLKNQEMQNTPWEISVDLSSKNMELISQAGSPLVVTGGRAPWVGKQDFYISFNSSTGNKQLVVPVYVSLPDMVVVAVQSVRTGEVVRAHHLELQVVPAKFQNRELISRVEDVVGKQVVRSFIPGQPVEAKSIQSPRLVKRGDIVTVYSRAAGIRVRTTAIAQKEGSLGELIFVQSLDKKRRYVARVSRFQEVEVYAGGLVIGTDRKE